MAINTSLQSIIEGLIDRIAHAIAARAPAGEKRKPGRPLGSGRAAVKPDGRSKGARLCPVPGCGEPGAGPRNRFFCRDHAANLSVTEQKKLLAQSKGQRNASAPPAARKAGRRAGRKMDMQCRVPGCPNLSRGPRFSFICDMHRKDLTKAEQRSVREKYNARKAA